MGYSTWGAVFLTLAIGCSTTPPDDSESTAGLASPVADPTVGLTLRHVESGELYDAVGRPLADGELSLGLDASPLEPLPGYNQFWFAWSVFNNGSDLFGQDSPVETADIVAEEQCAVPCEEIRPGCPGKDCIPALSRPVFVAPNDEKASYLSDESFVVGVSINGDTRAYPHNILWWHEIVNDTVGGMPIAVTHCPLTFSSLGYDPTQFVPGQTVELGVSGKLFNSNLVFYNRADDTYFSQLLGKGTMGDGLNDPAPRVHVWEMTWGAWKTLFPESVVMSGDSADTGHARDYQRYPYGSYFDDHGNTFSTPTPLPDPVYQNKQLTYGIRLGDGSKAYVHDELAAWANDTYGPGARQGVFMDEVGGEEIVLVFDLDAAYVQAFSSEIEGTWELAQPAVPAEVSCGDAGECSSDELCVATRGALCMPLPKEGESCQQGCVLTEHCCNCTAFSCAALPEECSSGASCGCISKAQDAGFLDLGCPANRSECSDTGGTVLTCIQVDFDEDPFAESAP